MKTYFKSILLYTMLLLSALSVKAKSTSERMSNMEVLSWNNCLTLPSFNSMPNKGIAGAFFGFSNDWLVLAGGTNFPDSVPWKGGTKQWHKTAYIKQAGSADQEWIVLPNTLPHPLAYGASIQIKQGILCIGGCGDRQCYSDVFLLKVQNGSVEIDKNWPSLPVPLANMTSSLLDNKIFVAGGQESVDAPIASKHFFMLDLSIGRRECR